PTGPWGGVAPDGSPIAAGDDMVALQFFEGAINLTLAGIQVGDLCSGTSTLIIKSRSSDSFTAELKDYALVPFQIVRAPSLSAGPDQALCSTGATTNFTMAGSLSDGTPTWSVV